MVFKSKYAPSGEFIVHGFVDSDSVAIMVERRKGKSVKKKVERMAALDAIVLVEGVRIVEGSIG